MKLSVYDGSEKITVLKNQLLDAALRYINFGNDGTKADRIRTASNLSGIPIRTLEVELERIGP